MARVQSVDDKVVPAFAGGANAHQSEWESASPTDRHERDSLDFCNLSDCEQLVRCLTHIADNRFYLVMTDVPDIVDVFVGTPLGTLITALSVVCFGLNNLYRNTISEVLFF